MQVSALDRKRWLSCRDLVGTPDGIFDAAVESKMLIPDGSLTTKRNAQLFHYCGGSEEEVEMGAEGREWGAWFRSDGQA